MSCGGTCSQTPPAITRSFVSGRFFASGRSFASDTALHLPSPFGWFSWLVDLQARWRARDELRSLSDAQLRDVGLTREQVEQAIRKPLWR